MKEIYLGGGCFWGTEEYFKQIKGVEKTRVGYANGDSTDPTYENLKLTKHAEVVHVKYDENIVGLSFILDMYYDVIDPLSVNKQGPDVGVQYRTGIYFTDANDVKIINESILNLEMKLGEKTAIEVCMLENYKDAEEYHQDYLEKNVSGYCHIGKDKFEKAKNTEPKV